MSTTRYMVITPVRNEEGNLPATIASVCAQTLRPKLWVIVDDGSSDKTGIIADAAAAENPWIIVVHRKDRGFRNPGTGVVEAFYDGFKHLQNTDWEFLAKLDGDLSFSPNYFELCFRAFEENSRLGIAGGLICRRTESELVEEWSGDPPFHVRGATKIYRRSCWDQLGGLTKAPGWDTIDELKANMLGWETKTLKALKLHQLKDTGSADGSRVNWVKNGLANYITGYHPLFMTVKCARRALRRPYGIGAVWLLWGFLSGYLRRVQRVEDPALIRYVRTQQFRKLTLRPNIWG